VKLLGGGMNVRDIGSCVSVGCSPWSGVEVGKLGILRFPGTNLNFGVRAQEVGRVEEKGGSNWSARPPDIAGGADEVGQKPALLRWGVKSGGWRREAQREQGLTCEAQFPPTNRPAGGGEVGVKGALESPSLFS